MPRVVAALAPEFEVDDRAVMRAVRSRSSVNVFHRSTGAATLGVVDLLTRAVADARL